MRTAWTLPVVAMSLAMASTALAQQPMNPYGASVSVEVGPTPPPVLPAPPVPPPQPLNPYGYPYGAYPAPPAYGYQPPIPGRLQSSPPAYQQGYYLYAGP